MVLRARSVIFLAALCSVLNFLQCDGLDDADTDDDDSLREALVLIKLIRRAGVSAGSREAHSLSKHEAIPAPLSPDSPQPLHNDSSYNNTFRSDREQSYRRYMSDGAKRFGPPDYNILSAKEDKRLDEVEKHHQGFYRRQNNEVDDTTATSEHLAIGDGYTEAPADLIEKTEGKNTTNTNNTAAVDNTDITPNAAEETTIGPSIIDDTTGASFRTTEEDELKTSEATTTTVKPKSQVTVYKKARTTKKKRAKYPRNRLKLKKLGRSAIRKKSATEHSDEKNVQMLLPDQENAVESQVEQELKNELDTVHDSENVFDAAWGIKASSIILTTKIPSTLRIHLQGSSRYPIPFPENHALCYTDPRNGLCRTP